MRSGPTTIPSPSTSPGADGALDPTEIALGRREVHDAATGPPGDVGGVAMRGPAIDAGTDEGEVARLDPDHAGSAAIDLPPGGILADPALAVADFLAPHAGPAAASGGGRVRADPAAGHRRVPRRGPPTTSGRSRAQARRILHGCPRRGTASTPTSRSARRAPRAPHLLPGAASAAIARRYGPA